MEGVTTSPADDGFASGYQELAPALLAWSSLRLLGPLRRRIDPEDLVQEILTRAYHSRRTFDPARGSFRGWLFGVAHNTLKRALLDLQRSPVAQSTWASTTSPDLIQRVPADATSISRAVARNEAVTRFIEGAAALDETDRKILMYRALQGLSHAEIAERVGESVSLVEKRWQRLRDRVRQSGVRGLVQE